MKLVVPTRAIEVRIVSPSGKSGNGKAQEGMSGRIFSVFIIELVVPGGNHFEKTH